MKIEKTYKKLRNALLMLVLGLLWNIASGQATQSFKVYPLDQETLPVYIEDTLYGDGGRLKFSSYKGGWDGVGAFKNGDELGMSRGLIVSNGWVERAEGNNNRGADYHERDYLGGNQDDDLNMLLAWIQDPSAHEPDSAVDASVVEFEFMPYYDQMQIKYLFASEEYLYHNENSQGPDVDMSDSAKSDVMGIFMWYNPNNKELLTRVGVEQHPVMVKFVNDNSPGGTWYDAKYIPNEQSLAKPNGYPTQYDGFTEVFMEYRDVQPCRNYKIKIAIADNPIYMEAPSGEPIGPHINSAVMVEAGSIKSGDGYQWGLEWDVNGVSDNPEFEANEIVEGGCSNMIIKLTKTVLTPDTIWVAYKIQNGADGEYIIDPPPKNDSLFYIPPDTLEFNYVLTALNDGTNEGEYESWMLRYQVDPCDYDQPGPIGSQGLSGEVPITVFERPPLVSANKSYGPNPADVYFCGNEVTVDVDDILEGGIPPYTQLWQSSTASGFGPEFNVPIAGNPEIVECTIKDRCSDIEGYNTGKDTVFIYSQLVVTQETPDFQLCENLEQAISVINTNAGNDFSVSWEFEGNIVSTSNPYVVSWDDYEQYYDVLDSLVFNYTVTDDCGNSSQGEIVAFWDPIVQIQGPEVICLGEEINLNCSEGQEYQWYEGSVSSGNEIPGATSNAYSYTPTSPGMKTICVEILNSCDQYAHTCFSFEVSEMTCEIEVVGSDELVVCPNSEFSLKELNGSYGWEWSWFDDGTSHSASGQEVDLSLLDPGMHTITVSAYDVNDCYDEREFEIMVNPYTELEVLSEFDSVCINTPFQLNTASAVNLDSVYWSASPADPSLTGQENNPAPLVSPEVPTTYTCYVMDENGCAEEQSKTVYIRPPIQGVLTTDPAGVCEQEDVLIDFDGSAAPGAEYHWSFENGNPDTSNSKQTIVYFNESGMQNIQLVIDEPGCLQNMDLQLMVNAKPVPDAVASEEQGCQPLEVFFENNSSELESPVFDWDFGDGGTSSEIEPVHVYDSAGLWDVSLTIENSTGCIASRTFPALVEVLPTPLAGFDVSSQAATLDNPNISFFEQIQGDFSYISWDFGDGASSGEENPEHTYDKPGVYQVIMETGNTYGCIDYDTLNITITTELKVYFPNAFSPNGDGKNDCFQVKGTVYDLLDNFEVFIHDRWGRMIHSSEIDNPDCLWDGTDEGGEVVPMGTYAYRLVGKDFKGKKRNFVGHIMVIR